MLTEAEYWGIILGLGGIGSGVIAIFIAIVVPNIIEGLRKPHIIVSLSPNVIPDTPSRFLHCTARNNPHRIFFWIDRNPAYEAFARLTFRRQGQEIFDPVVTKWTSAPECMTPVVQNVTNQPPPNLPLVNTVRVYDDTKTVFAHSRTLPSDRIGQEFDIVVKNSGDEECYAVRGRSYRFSGLRDPELSIPLGDFTVEVEVVGSNSRSRSVNFRLSNTGQDIRDIALTEV